HLLGCVKQLIFLPSKYYMGRVLQIPSDGDDPRKLKSKPKKNEYFEHLNKASAKKRFVPKTSQNGKLQTQKKTHFDHPIQILGRPNIRVGPMDPEGSCEKERNCKKQNIRKTAWI
ncbi:unnamed protein product, partial [Porites lobata]